MATREQMLSRVREALKDAEPAPEPVRDYVRSLDPGTDLVELLVDRLVDYKAEVVQVDRADLARTIGDLLSREGVASLVVPSDIDPTWLTTATLQVTQDSPSLTKTALNEIDAVLTACELAIAQTGTIILNGRAGQGRRVITLLPDLHVIVVRTDQIVGTVPEAVERLEPHRPMTWISGPSATSDIELERVEGVHGPRRLRVIIVG